MSWKEDRHGLVFRTREAKLYQPTHTWAHKLSQLGTQKGTVRIATYRLPGTKAAASDDY